MSGQRRPDPRERIPAASLRVLIVDGNQDAADSLHLLLSLWGYDARVAYQAHSALMIADAFQPHVIVSEILLPDRDGYSLAETFPACNDGTPPLLVALTTSGRPEDRLRAQKAGYEFHLLKPPDLDLLLELLVRASCVFGIEPRNSSVML